MLKVTIEPGKQGVIIADGDMRTILADLSAVIKGIHQQIAQMSQQEADVFKRALQMGIMLDNGPVWGIDIPGMGFSTIRPKKPGTD